jgi:GNAT superfamily N-acetyltransferase
MARPVSAPEPLEARHDLSRFSSGELSIDHWLRAHARAAEGRTARTYVACVEGAVVGYHAIATGSVERGGMPRSLRHGNPDPVPVAIIARLGVTAEWQGRGLGRDLLQDAIRRILHAGEIVGLRAILVHSLNKNASRFYLGHGFRASPIDPRTMLLSLETARAVL